MLFDRAKCTTATTGAGTITVGSAVAGFVTFAAAGATDGVPVSILIEQGSDWELSEGVYSTTGPTITRATLIASSTGSKLNLGGSATVASVVLAKNIYRDWETIGNITLSSTRANVTFSNIPQNYANLAILFEPALVSAGTSLTIAVSNNGTTYTSSTIYAGFGTGDTSPYYGVLSVPGYRSNIITMLGLPLFNLSSNGGGSQDFTSNGKTIGLWCPGGIKYIRIGAGARNLVSGASITLKGL